jgi:hypothetical protein
MLQWWRARPTGAEKLTQRSAARPTRRFRPRMEVLEDRTVPSTGFVPLQPFQSTGALAGISPKAIATGDFNGDGKIDLAMANFGNNNIVTVLTGKGDGRFNPLGAGGSTNITLKNTLPGDILTAVAAADFNNEGDNISDIAVVETNPVTGASRIHILNGSLGGLIEVNTLNPGSATPIYAMAVGDFNGDGLPDIAVAEQNNLVDFFYNVGGGNFLAPVQLSTGQKGAEAIAIGQFNGDTIPDLAVLSSNGTAGPVTVTTLIGQGSASGTNATHFVLGPNSTFPALNNSLATFDMASPFVFGQGSLTPFLVVTSTTANSATVLPALGNGTFASVGPISLGLPSAGFANSVVAADFNGDGLPDFATANSNGTVTIVQNNGNNNYTLFASPPTNPVPFSTNQVAALALGRFTNTGKRDIVGVDVNTSTSISSAGVLQNQFSNAYFAVGTDAGSLTQVNLYDQNGNLLATFLPFIGSAYTGGARVAVGDVTGDGVPDLIVANGVALGGLAIFKIYDGAKLLALAKQGIPGQNAESALLAAVQPYGLVGIGLGDFVAVGNLNGNPNGVDQIIVGADGINGQVSIFTFNPSGNTVTLAQTLVVYAGFTGGVRVAAGDVNGDGRDDLITGAGTNALPEVRVYLGITDPMLFINSNPFAIFQGIAIPPGVSFTGGAYVAAGDFDGDGLADIAVSAGPGGGPQVQIFPGKAIKAKQSGVTFTDASGFNNVIVPPGSPYRGGARVGVTQGIYPDPENASSTMLQTVLLSSSGPGGNQYTVFDGYTFLTKLFGTGQQPPQFVGQFVQPVSATDSTGEFIS